MPKKKNKNSTPGNNEYHDSKNLLAGVKKEDMELVEPVKEKKTKPLHRYFSYQFRIVVLLAIFFVLFYLANLLVLKSIELEADKTIKFDEQSNIDYKVKLQPNSFYDQQYLDKNMSYVANLIDSVIINYNYSFNSEKELTGEYKYRVLADFTISNKDTDEVFLNKEYVIKDYTTKKIEDSKNINIYENVEVKYFDFNDIANSFKMTYGVDSVSNVVYKLEVVKSFDSYSFESDGINNTSYSSITIPLSQKAVSIKLDCKNVNNHSNLNIVKKYKFTDIPYLIVGVLLCGLAIVVLLKAITLLYKLQPKKSAYDKELSRILKEYDRFIVNTETMPEMDQFTITKLNKFEELLDARDNLNKPIFYYNVTTHNKCYFFIKNDNELILYKMKNLD